MKQSTLLLIGGAIILYFLATQKSSAGTVANPNPGPGNVNMGGQDFGAGVSQTW